MKNKTKQSTIKEETIHQETVTIQDEFFDRCIRLGLIEKTAFGYYFAPEFFEILDKDLKEKCTTGEKKLPITIRLESK